MDVNSSQEINIFDIMLWFTYALVILGVILSIALPLIKLLIDNPKGLLKTLGGIFFMGILLSICIGLSSDEVLPKFEGDPFNLTPGMSRTIGGMLIMTYVLSIGTILSIVVTELSKAFK
ncbi:MAG: hypothetical protein ACK5BR_06145 [Bacteroidota bacterium]|jgi:hypothetical protein|nr:hypothetical protein [Algoriphagus sp.]